MSFEKSEITAMAAAAPEHSFMGAAQMKIAEWIEFVTSVDENPKDSHPLIFYGLVARILAEGVGSLAPVAYADPHMRNIVLQIVQLGAVPFEEDREGLWCDQTVNPAHLSLCLRVQGKAQKLADVSIGASDAGPGGGQTLAQAIASLTSATSAKDTKKDVLSYDLKTRLGEVGLASFARELLPSEETLIGLEKKGKRAREKGRHYVGSSDGEDLMANFRPAWPRAPKVDAFVGEGPSMTK